VTGAVGCEQWRELAPELALGTLAGSERAVALAHVLTCEACRAEMDDLAVIADRLLLLAPEDEPPMGFESRVLARMRLPEARVTRPRRSRRRMAVLLASAAAVVAVAGGVGLMAGSTSHDHVPGLTSEYVAALQALGGRSLRAGPLLDGSGQRVGQAFIYDGSRSWVFVSVDHAGRDGVYTVVCTGPNAGPVSWSGMRVMDGRGSLGFAADGDVHGLEQVRLVEPSGHAPYVASL